jgi:hypothetical protein
MGSEVRVEAGRGAGLLGALPQQQQREVTCDLIDACYTRTRATTVRGRAPSGRVHCEEEYYGTSEVHDCSSVPPPFPPQTGGDGGTSTQDRGGALRYVSPPKGSCAAQAEWWDPDLRWQMQTLGPT